MAILTNQMKRVIREQKLGFVATVCPDGTPNLSPKGTLKVLDEDHLIFADIRSPRTVSNLQTNPSIEINVVDQVLRKGYRFKGKARVLHKGDGLYNESLEVIKRDVTDADRRVKSIVLVAVEHAAALTSPGYDLGATEEQVKAAWQKYWADLRSGETTEETLVL